MTSAPSARNRLSDDEFVCKNEYYLHLSYLKQILENVSANEIQK